MLIDIKYWHSLLDVGDARLKFSIPVFPTFTLNIQSTPYITPISSTLQGGPKSETLSTYLKSTLYSCESTLDKIVHYEV